MTLSPSGIDFPTVGEEIAYYLGHIGKDFIGGRSGSGENGIDVTMPMDTPVYAVQSGTVKGAGYYAGGGVVSVDSGHGRVWYYQHLDQNEATAGQPVQAGQLIGWSGGQNTGGNHPADPNYSSWQHIEIGINAPWGGMWGGNPGGESIDPKPALAQEMVRNQNVQTSQHGGSSGGGGGGGGSFNWTDPTTWAPAFEQGFLSGLGIPNIQDLLWRMAFVVVGLILIIVGIVILFRTPIESGVGTIVGAAAKAP